jgi:hypothetical protein
MGMAGVPVGAQVEVEEASRSGIPPASTRVDPLVHWQVTQGPLPAFGGGMVQPATVHGAPSVVTGWPETMTRGMTTLAVTWPAWAHITVQPR